MKFVAITGSFASGKSFVLKYLQGIGYSTFSCDDFVRELYRDLSVQADLVKTIDGLREDNLKTEQFDKKKLIKIIYENDKQREKLEQYIHPLVKEGIEDFKKKHFGEKLLFVEVPLLFEAGFNNYFDVSICVYCSEVVRENRAQNRGNFDVKIFNKIKHIQLPQSKKKELADFLVNTDLNNEEVKRQVNKIIEKLNEY